ncbi:unnamed protein product [Prunus armeniaca]
MEEGTNIMEHASAFNRCIADLQRVYEVYKSEDKAVMLLTSLPPFYKLFRMTHMFSNRTFNYEVVMQDILIRDRMLQHS